MDSGQQDCIDIPVQLRTRAAGWDRLKRWERREVAQALRQLGLSYSEIRGVVTVPKGTLSEWCRDIELTPQQQARLLLLRPAQAVRVENARKRRLRTIERHDAIRARARLEARRLCTDPFWAAGITAYWAEGTKGWGSVKFANSDPEMIVLFIRWAERFLDVGSDRLTLSLHLHSGQLDAESRQFWSERTQIPLAQFGKTFVKVEGTGHRKNVLYTGTASVRIRRSGDLLQRVLGWVEAVGELWGR